MANLDTWITSSKPPDNIVLSSYRVAIWDTLCSNASDSINKSLPSGVLYLHNTYEPEGSDEVDSVWQTCYRNTVVFVFVSCVLQTVDALIERWREEQEG